MWIYVGTYGAGVYRVGWDEGTGGLGGVDVAGAAIKPSFLVRHPVLPVLYSVHADLDVSDPGRRGVVRAFRVDADGGLGVMHEESVGGHAPCHLAVDPSGSRLYFADYHGATVGVLPLGDGGEPGAVASVRRHCGSGPHPSRQTSAHIHSVNVDGEARFAHVADLGTDELRTYRICDGALHPHDPSGLKMAPGSGPRHLSFRPGGAVAYLIHELDSTIAVLGYAASDGRFSVRQVVSTLPSGYREANTAAEVAVHPSGRFVYGSNRGHDSIAVFAAGDDGLLSLEQHVPSGGRGPRHFAVDPTGRFLVAANQQSDNLAVFEIDPQRGSLTPVSTGARVPAPVCVLFWDA